MVLEIKETTYVPLDTFVIVSLAILGLVIGGFLYMFNKIGKIYKNIDDNDHTHKYETLVKDLETLEKNHNDSTRINLELFGRINVTLGRLDTTMVGLKEVMQDVKKDLKDDVNRKFDEMSKWVSKVEQKIDKKNGN